MTDDGKNAFFALLLGWFFVNGLIAFVFLQERVFDKTCHSWRRIEYIMPGARVGCEVGGVASDGLDWLFGEAK